MIKLKKKKKKKSKYGQGVVREKELRCFYLIIHTNYASQTILSAQCGLYWSTNDWTAV